MTAEMDEAARRYTDEKVEALRAELLGRGGGLAQGPTLESRRLLVMGVLHSIVNMPILYVEMRKANTPYLASRADRCNEAIRQVGTEAVGQIEASEAPEAVLGQVQARVNEILRDHEMPFVRAAG